MRHVRSPSLLYPLFSRSISRTLPAHAAPLSPAPPLPPPLPPQEAFELAPEWIERFAATEARRRERAAAKRAGTERTAARRGLSVGPDGRVMSVAERVGRLVAAPDAQLGPLAEGLPTPALDGVPGFREPELPPVCSRCEVPQLRALALAVLGGLASNAPALARSRTLRCGGLRARCKARGAHGAATGRAT